MSNCSCCHSEPDVCNETLEPSGIKIYLPILLSSLLLLTGIIAAQTDFLFFHNERVRIVWYLLAYLPVGLPVLKEAIEGISKKDLFNEFTLMSLATLGAFYIGEYPEGVAVMLFYAVGEIFQDKAVGKARRSITALLDVRPKTARLVTSEIVDTVCVSQIKVGDTLEVRVGERVPFDGNLLDDKSAAFNTSALTGESVPRTIYSGEEVLAGMIATEKVIRIRVNKPYDQSSLSKMLELVQHAAKNKAPAELFIRKFARIYTPVVTGLALLIVLLPALYSQINPSFAYDFNNWLYRGLVFLVVSCPCALVISVPLGYFGGIGAASRHGILFKGSNYLDAISRLNMIVFDKTGTLTKGVFEVQDIVCTENITEERLLTVIASAEAQSNHPIAQAIEKKAKEKGIAYEKVTNTKELAGYGLKTKINSLEILVGNVKLLDKEKVLYPSSLKQVTDTIVVCSIAGSYVGHLTLADSPKEDLRDTIEKLKILNIHNTVILSGDKQVIVNRLAANYNIPTAIGDLLPEEKVRYMEELKSKGDNKIAFVGDGMNDAPVLALSDVGIAMGGLGSDVAIETADVVIQTDQPSKVPTAILIGRATQTIIKQNITLAFGIKILILALGVGGLATLWEAVFADVGVALLAILNAVRIQRMHFK